MAKPDKSRLIRVITLLIIAGLVYWLGMPEIEDPKPEEEVRIPEGGTELSILADPPNWTRLEAFQRSITRSDFEQLLTSIYTAGDGWKEWISIDEEAATLITHEEIYRLEFAPSNKPLPEARYWRYAHEMGPAPVGRPLEGVHVALDPGHLGGQWAKMEARWLVIGQNPPICEGDMTLRVAELMRERLEALGATVSLVRENSTPQTALRPDDLMGKALEEEADEERARKLAQKWFYRTAEIRARSLIVNQGIKPDIVLALHFNAEAWGDPANPRLLDHSHIHMLVHGGYGDDELALEDQRHAMLLKLLGRGHAEEKSVAKAMMEVFREVSPHPAFQYSATNPYVCEVPEAEGVWARNLLANRLYDCPVVYLEPYLMNSRLDYPRMLAGDYVGVREVDGKPQISIFREYAEAAVAGLVRHYSKSR
ncbi:MAG: hypothetical protein R3242_07210 [Akkermansiaceae bacterium]|nr:hypothetical protein [Akkermansiaceae bacterium]